LNENQKNAELQIKAPHVSGALACLGVRVTHGGRPRGLPAVLKIPVNIHSVTQVTSGWLQPTCGRVCEQASTEQNFWKSAKIDIEQAV